MNAQTLFEAEALLATARTLSPLQRQILTSLNDRGPGLLLEVAVRIYKFPEEISSEVQALRQQGLIAASAYAGGQLGSELIALSEEGRQVARLLQDPAVIKDLQAAGTRALSSATESARAPDPQQQQLEITQKLARLAEQRGDLEEASQWYKEALTISKGLTSPAGQ